MSVWLRQLEAFVISRMVWLYPAYAGDSDVGRRAAGVPDCGGKPVSMLRGMARITVTMDDRLAEAVRATAGDNVSGWLANVVRAELLRRAVALEIACDQQHPDYRAWRAERLDEVDEAQV